MKSILKSARMLKLWTLKLPLFALCGGALSLVAGAQEYIGVGGLVSSCVVTKITDLRHLAGQISLGSRIRVRKNNSGLSLDLATTGFKKVAEEQMFTFERIFTATLEPEGSGYYILIDPGYADETGSLMGWVKGIDREVNNAGVPAHIADLKCDPHKTADQIAQEKKVAAEALSRSLEVNLLWGYGFALKDIARETTQAADAVAAQQNQPAKLTTKVNVVVSTNSGWTLEAAQSRIDLLRSKLDSCNIALDVSSTLDIENVLENKAALSGWDVQRLSSLVRVLDLFEGGKLNLIFTSHVAPKDRSDLAFRFFSRDSNQKKVLKSLVVGSYKQLLEKTRDNADAAPEWDALLQMATVKATSRDSAPQTASEAEKAERDCKIVQDFLKR